MSIVNVHVATLLYPDIQNAASEPAEKSEEAHTRLADVKKTKTKEKDRLMAEQAIQSLRSKVAAAEVEIVHAAEALAEAAKSKVAESEKAKPTDKLTTGLTEKENKEFGKADSDRITGRRKRKAHKAYKVRRAQSAEKIRVEERVKAEEMNRGVGDKAFEMDADDKDVESREDIGIFGRHVTVTAEAVSPIQATTFASKYTIEETELSFS